MYGKMEQCICITFCLQLSKSSTETLEMLREAFENILYAGQRLINGIHFSRPGECWLKMTNVLGRLSTSKTTESVEKIENLSTKTAAE
jgi:hypothetical protein